MYNYNVYFLAGTPHSPFVVEVETEYRLLGPQTNAEGLMMACPNPVMAEILSALAPKYANIVLQSIVEVNSG